MECLQYLSEDLVTPELMRYASDLIRLFDDNVSEPIVASELQPTFVDLYKLVRVNRVIGRGRKRSGADSVQGNTGSCTKRP